MSEHEKLIDLFQQELWEEDLLEKEYLAAEKKYRKICARNSSVTKDMDWDKAIGYIKEHFGEETKTALEKMKEVKQKFLQAIVDHQNRQIQEGEKKPLDPGQYQVKVSYPYRLRRENRPDEFDIKEQILYPITTYKGATIADLVKRGFGSISMEGLHNFGLYTGDLGIAPVDVKIAKVGDEKFSPIKLHIWLTSGGHIVSPDTRLQ